MTTDVLKHFANELNDIYSTFDATDFNDDRSSFIARLISECNMFNQSGFNEIDVYKLFCNVKVNKAYDRGNISSYVIKTCAFQPVPIFTKIFQLSVYSGDIILIWKTSAMTPVLKSKVITLLNDYRHVALTTNITKCFGKLILHLLLKEKCNYGSIKICISRQTG